MSVSRLRLGLVANNTLEQDDLQLYAWIYPFFTYSDEVAVTARRKTRQWPRIGIGINK